MISAEQVQRQNVANERVGAALSALFTVELMLPHDCAERVAIYRYRTALQGMRDSLVGLAVK